MKLFVLFIISLLGLNGFALADSDNNEADLICWSPPSHIFKEVTEIKLDTQGNLIYTNTYEAGYDFTCKNYKINYHEFHTSFTCPDELKTIIIEASFLKNRFHQKGQLLLQVETLKSLVLSYCYLVKNLLKREFTDNNQT